jgi:hypothetical protein
MLVYNIKVTHPRPTTSLCKRATCEHSLTATATSAALAADIITLPLPELCTATVLLPLLALAAEGVCNCCCCCCCCCIALTPLVLPGVGGTLRLPVIAVEVPETELVMKRSYASAAAARCESTSRLREPSVSSSSADSATPSQAAA